MVEHDEEIIRAADYIIDVGPKAGSYGGNIVYRGDLADIAPGSNSYTLKYLLGEETIDVPKHRRTSNNNIIIKGARENNLKGIDVNIPLNTFTVVSGVSGSGKSTLVRNILYRSLMRHFGNVCDAPGQCVAVEGALKQLGGDSEDQPESMFDRLSERELQIAMMVVDCQKVQDISDKLCLSPKTVNSYRYRIFEKLEISSDVELALMAVRFGLLDADKV